MVLIRFAVNPEFLYARNGMDADGLYEAMKAMF